MRGCAMKGTCPPTTRTDGSPDIVENVAYSPGVDFEYGKPFAPDGGKSVDQIMAESRAPDPVGPVFRNAAGDVTVEVTYADETHVHFMRLRKDGRRVNGRKETAQMTHKRFEDLYSPVS